MEELIFATNNRHKVEEIQSAVGNQITIIPLADAGIFIDIPEPYDTIEENASAKSATIYQLTGKNCFGEDTGLEVDALYGEPGVKSARYAGDERDFKKNIDKLLEALQHETNRKARFRTVISLLWQAREFRFDGITYGTICREPRGANGFGYDAIFVPDGDTRTFAEMSLSEKNRLSHRRQAADKLVIFLRERIDSVEQR